MWVFAWQVFPEPGSITLWLAGVLMLMWRRGKK